MTSRASTPSGSPGPRGGRIARRPGVLGLLIGATLLCAACSADISVEGVVSGSAGEPIAGAIVTLQDHSHAAAFETTDAKGSFLVKLSRQPGPRYPFTLSVSAPERQTIQTDLADAGSFRCNVRLARADPKAARAPAQRVERICVKTDTPR